MPGFEVDIKTRLFSKARHRKIMINLFKRTMEHVRLHLLPKHFERIGFSRYGFKARSVRYTRWKRRIVEHNLPNVFSGQLKSSILLRSRTTSTSTHGRLYGRMGHQGQYMSGPRKNQFYTRALPDERRQELESLTEEEARKMADWFGQTYAELIDIPRQGFDDFIVSDALGWPRE